MATTFINAPLNNRPVLTSAFYSLRATTDSPKVRVEVIRDPAGESDAMFSTELYPSGNIVEFSDIGSLIETHFREKGIIWDTVEIRFNEASIAFTVLYCDFILDPDFDGTETFLCASGVSEVHRNSAISLAHWDHDTDEYRIQIVGLDSQHKTAVVERTVRHKKNSYEISFSVNQIIAMACDAEYGDCLDTVSYFAISYASMRKIFHLVEHPFFLTFCFRNMFNATEYVDVVGTVIRKTAVDSESAFCGGNILQYNQAVTRTYEMSTAPLTDDQVRELEQLVCSRSIKLCAGDYEYDVVISDLSAEIDNNDEGLNAMKFTFRFVNKRPLLVSSEIKALMPSDSHIFSNQFTPEFA
ncbi:MAG: hypothetical protein HDS52_07285 [Barnesiella sp.]|nr:hypothetical protein [Barnesiella sp.]